MVSPPRPRRASAEEGSGTDTTVTVRVAPEAKKSFPEDSIGLRSKLNSEPSLRIPERVTARSLIVKAPSSVEAVSYTHLTLPTILLV